MSADTASATTAPQGAVKLDGDVPVDRGVRRLFILIVVVWCIYKAHIVVEPDRPMSN